MVTAIIAWDIAKPSTSSAVNVIEDHDVSYASEDDGKSKRAAVKRMVVILVKRRSILRFNLQ